MRRRQSRPFPVPSPGARRWIAALCVLAAVLALAPSAHAGGNAGAAVWLTWNATDKTVTDLQTPGPSNSLYLYVSRAGGVQFKGAELDLTWTPAGDPGAGCYAHLGTTFRTSSGTTCTYLNRGTAVPVTVNDDPGHYHVAWANTTPFTGCTAGAIIQIAFGFDGCPTAGGTFTLNSLILLDVANVQDVATVSGSQATVLGGAGDGAPVVDPIADQWIDPGHLLVVQPHGSDPDGDSLQWSGLNLPAGSAVDPFTGRFTWIPDSTQGGHYAGVTLVARDPQGLSGSAAFAITVGGANHPPVLDPIGSFTIEETQVVSFTAHATDPDGDALTYAASPLPAGASFTAQTFTWLPTIGQAGTYVVTVSATDPGGLGDSEPVTITVRPRPSGDSLRASLTWSTTGVVTDLTTQGSSHGLYVRLTGASSYKGAEIDLTWTPANPGCFEMGSVSFRTSTTCTWLNRGTSVPITTFDEPGHYHVAWANNSVNTSCAGGGNIVDLQIEFSGCSLTPGCLTLQGMLVLDGNNVTYTPQIDDPVATVLGGSADCSRVNHAPVVTPIPDQAVLLGHTLVVIPAGSDADGDPLVWSGSNLPDGALVDAGTGVLTWTPSLSQAGTYTGVTLTATDPLFATGSATFTITATSNLPPVVDPIPDQLVAPNTAVTILPTAHDPEGDSLTWTMSGNPVDATLDAWSGRFFWPGSPTEVTYPAVTLFAHDVAGGRGGATFAIVVAPPAQQPAVFYVDSQSACDSCDGRSWATAVRTLEQGFALATPGILDTVRVAEGTYNALNATPPATTKVYGGYPHGGGPRDLQRRHSLVRPADRSNSAIALSAQDVVLDGFVVSGASQMPLVFVTGGRDTVRAVIATNCRTALGIVRVSYTDGDVLIDRCIFDGNVTSQFGSIMVDLGTNVTVRDCDVVADSTVSPTHTAGIYVIGTATVVNTVLWRLAPAGSPPIFNAGGTVYVRYSDVQGGYPGIGNIDAEPRFCNPRARAFALRGNSPLIGAGEAGTTIGTFDIVGCSAHSGAVADDGVLPERTALTSTAPVVSSRGIEIGFTLAAPERVALDVFTVRGARVTSLARGPMEAGAYSIAWARRGDDGLRLPAGVYVVRFSAGGVTQTRRVCVVE